MPGAFKLIRGRPTAPPLPEGGVTTTVTVSLPKWGKTLLAVTTALSAISAYPAANAITLTQSLANPVQLTLGAIYVSGDAVIPPPSAAYDGTEGSGFTAWTEDGNARTMTPEFSATDGNGTGALGIETRTTAKPVMQMLTIPHQRIAGRFAILLKAEAKGGVAKVRVGFEGGYRDLTTQTQHRYTDANGTEQWFYGYVCEIDSANYTGLADDATRGGQFWARAYPNDAGMQTQLLFSNDGYSGVGTPGATRSTRLCFYPATQPHGYLINVTPSAGADSWTGSTYPAANATFTTLRKAIDYAKGTAQTIGGNSRSITGGLAPRIEFTENDPAHIVTDGSNYANGTRGWLTITTAPGVTNVTLKKAAGAASLWNPGYCGTEFRGKALYIDATNISGFATSPSQVDRYWYWANGMGGIACDWDMATQTDNAGNIRDWSPGFRYQTDCPDLKWVNGNGASQPCVCLNNRRSKLSSNDIYSGADAVFGDVCTDVGADLWRTPQPAFSLTYAGAGVPSIATTANNGASGNFLLKVDSGTAGTITLGSKRLSAVISEVNAVAGWTAVATYTPNDRFTDRLAVYLTPTTGLSQGAWSATMTTGVPYSVKTSCDFHIDLYQSFNGITGGEMNKYVGHVRGYDFRQVQCLFLDGKISDSAFKNVFIDVDPQGVSAQISKKSNPLKHIMVENYSVPAQPMKFVNTDGATAFDTYCTFSGNVFASLGWDLPASATAYPVVTACHFLNGYANAGAQVAVGVSTGGTILVNHTDVYPTADTTLDLAPAGPLLTTGNLTAPRIAYDAQGAAFPSLAVKGAISAPMGNATLTRTQALQLAAITASDTVGSGVGYVELSGRRGVGETGPIDTLRIVFDVAA